MAGIDILGQFPNSRMAAAAKLGQSRFRSTEGVAIPATFNTAATPANVETGTNVAIVSGGGGGAATLSEKVATFTTAGATTRAALLAALGYTTQLAFLQLTVKTSVSGVTFAQGGGTVTLTAGSSITLGTRDGAPVVSDFSMTLASGDVVLVQAVGY